MVEELRREDPVDARVGERSSKRVRGDQAVDPEEAARGCQVRDLAVERNHRQRNAHARRAAPEVGRKIARAGAEVEHGLRAAGGGDRPEQRYVRGAPSAPESIHPADVAERFLDLVEGKIAGVEPLGLRPALAEGENHEIFWSTSAEFFDPKAMQLQSAASKAAGRADPAT